MRTAPAGPSLCIPATTVVKRTPPAVDIPVPAPPVATSMVTPRLSGHVPRRIPQPRGGIVGHEMRVKNMKLGIISYTFGRRDDADCEEHFMHAAGDIVDGFARRREYDQSAGRFSDGVMGWVLPTGLEIWIWLMEPRLCGPTLVASWYPRPAWMIAGKRRTRELSKRVQASGAISRSIGIRSLDSIHIGSGLRQPGRPRVARSA